MAMYSRSLRVSRSCLIYLTLLSNVIRERILISHEQWDIYKLDPAYECTISPLYAKIIRRDPNSYFSGSLPTTSSQEPVTDTSKHPRRSSQGPTTKCARRTPKIIQVLSDVDVEDEDEIQELIVDPTSPEGRLIPGSYVNAPPRRTTRDHIYDQPRTVKVKAQCQQPAAPSSPPFSQSMPNTSSTSSQPLPAFGSPTKQKRMNSVYLYRVLVLMMHR